MTLRVACVTHRAWLKQVICRLSHEMFNKSNFDSHREYLIPAIYCVSGALYIAGSDLLLGRFVTESNRLWIGTAKGIGFVFFTSLVLLLLLKYEKRRRANSEVFFRRLVESMQDAVLVLEVPERKIIYANEAASHIFGYSNAELLGQSSEILHISRRNFEEFETRSAPALRDNKTFQAEFQMRHRDGRIIPTAHSVSLIERKNRSTLALSLVKDYTPLQLMVCRH